MTDIKCFQCVGENKHFVVRREAGLIDEDQVAPPIRDAVTWVPLWQQTAVITQMVVACVTVPVCMEHVTVQELSAEEKAMMGGKLLQGRVDVKGLG